MASGRVPNTNITFFMWNELLFIVITIIINIQIIGAGNGIYYSIAQIFECKKQPQRLAVKTLHKKMVVSLWLLYCICSWWWY